MSNQPPSVLLTTSDEQQTASLSRRPSSARSILVPSNKSSGNGDLFQVFKTSGQPELCTPTSPIPTQHQPELPVFNNVEDFEMHQPIGYGSSAIVYSALYKPLNKRVAVKIIDLDMFERNQIDELRRETALMALSKHPNVLRVYGSFVNGSKLYIVTPYSAGGSCLDIMKTGFPNGFDEISIATILKQALEGIAYFHKNGHIHRDVKAGNLLMDDDGTVLLADFGVSSSLMESGERGKRKTFVGTPCWMAPEVMEQAGYDYKADIWSFGVTSIELATGHAPYAKLPPLKVLMMTLSNDPPTIDREATEYKYSKIFKDMVDSCMVKDPEKRPSAEKLLQHPFFKQSKRKDYLVKSILQDLTPLEQRPRRKISQRQITITKTDEWDFDNDDTNDDNQDIPITDNNNDPPFQQQQQRQQQQQNHTPKRHISFGDVVIRNPPQPSAISSPSAATTTATATMTTITSDQLSSSTRQQPKKSRFVIEETSYGDHPGSMLTNSSMRSLSPPAVTDIVDTKDDQMDGEITKVGRFHINQSALRQPSSGDTTHSFTDSVNDDRNSQDTTGDRKSRFEVLGHSPQSSTSIMPYQSVPLSRENSNHGTHASTPLQPPQPSALSREGSARTRSPLAERELDNQSTGESRKIGRFQLTTGGNVTDPSRFAPLEGSHTYDSSHSMSASSSTTSPSSSLLRGQLFRTNTGTAHDITPSTLLLNQFEELLRYNETQRQLIQDIYSSTGLSKAKPTSNHSSKTTNIVGEKPSSDDLPATVAYLEQLVLSSTKENQVLQKENDALRRELYALRGSNT
ncbi:kinase-like domain-containing protein [Chlamydoabsidia padenii]|nr:kinase-like domain-containing protein [Chlamydoabsidia padenii]